MSLLIEEHEKNFIELTKKFKYNKEFYAFKIDKETKKQELEFLNILKKNRDYSYLFDEKEFRHERSYYKRTLFTMLTLLSYLNGKLKIQAGYENCDGGENNIQIMKINSIHNLFLLKANEIGQSATIEKATIKKKTNESSQTNR